MSLVVGEEGPACFVLLWFTTYMLSVVVCSLALLVSSVGYGNYVTGSLGDFLYKFTRFKEINLIMTGIACQTEHLIKLA